MIHSFRRFTIVLAIVAGEGMRGSVEIDSFSLDGKWGYAYKKGLFKWSDSGTFSLAFKRLKVNIIMSIAIEEPSKQLKFVISSCTRSLDFGLSSLMSSFVEWANCTFAQASFIWTFALSF